MGFPHSFCNETLEGFRGSERTEEVDTSELAETLEAARERLAAMESSIEGGGTESMMSWAFENTSWRYSLASASDVGTDEKGVGLSLWRAEWRAAMASDAVWFPGGNSTNVQKSTIL